MPTILSVGGQTPKFGARVYVAPTAAVLGDVEIDEDASVWFGAVLRGDVGRIRIGKRTNVQDLTCIHMTSGISDAEIGSDVTIGHGAILHGCRIEDGCLVGMGSILLDGCVIGEGSFIAAGSLVAPRTVIPKGSFALGRPAHVVRAVTPKESSMVVQAVLHYIELARTYARGGE